MREYSIKLYDAEKRDDFIRENHSLYSTPQSRVLISSDLLNTERTHSRVETYLHLYMPVARRFVINFYVNFILFLE